MYSPGGRKSACRCVHHEMREGYAADRKPVAENIKSAGAVSENPDIVTCRGVGVDVLKTLDKMPSSKFGLQYTLGNHKLQVEKLLRKPSYSVLSRIELLALLKSLLPLIVECLYLKWMRNTQYLCNV